MYQGTNQAHPGCRKKSYPPSVLTRVAVLALACYSGLDSVSMADDSAPPADARLTQSTKKPAPGGTEETGGTERRETSGAVDQGSTGTSRPLTNQQKRIFVLGLGASEKK